MLGLTLETPLLEMLLSEQGTAIERFSSWQEQTQAATSFYRRQIPLTRPAAGEQYAFEVNLDQCTGCKACVVACHSLNGLDESESWRTVGSVRAKKTGYARSLQTITSACHHCLDPACADGCPVLAYEKDAETGIVRHLDDQCIGCSYCLFKCPYDVPKYSKRLGIVRKCDMCQGRLAEGEAPACVQACPTEAISIKLVNKSSVSAEGCLVPGAAASFITTPTTRYVSSKPLDAWMEPDDVKSRPLDLPHLPLVFMLLLTQAAAGGFVASALHGGQQKLEMLSLAACVVGLTASFMHLGQPLKAVRAVIGWRKSWLSREIIALSLFAKLAVLAVLWPHPWLSITAAIFGLVGVFTSVMVYADTKRPRWSFPITASRFFGTTVGFCLLLYFEASIWLVLVAFVALFFERKHFFTHARGGKMPGN